MNDNLTLSMTKNKDTLREMFGESVDFYTKEISILGFDCCICMFENLSSIERLWIMMLDYLSHKEKKPKNAQELFDFIFAGTALPVERNPVTTFDEARIQLTVGTSLILINGCNKAVVMSTQSMQFRSVQEPSGENNLRGSREGFTELIRVNISMIRRLIRTEEFCTQTMTLGSRTQTDIALCYNSKLVDKKTLDNVKSRLQKSDLTMLLDTGYLAPFLQKGKFSFFSAVGYTERPDTAAAKICEGKIVIIANGTPFALIAPYFFVENFDSMDDYSSKAYFASLMRIIKYAAFFIAVMLTGVFVSISNFTPELLPEQLLYKIASAEQATPLPLFLEAIFINFMLEIVREAGLRMPKAIGHSVSLVSALIIGDAAVRAGIVGTPIVIIAAITALCSFVVPSMYEAITVLRFLFIFAGGLFGPFGIAAMFLVMLFNICGMESFDIPYTSPISPAGKSVWQDGIIRQSLKKLSKNKFTVESLPKNMGEEDE